MALDPLEKERLRKRMALKMQAFVGAARAVTCVSSHWYAEPHPCDLCQQPHTQEGMVIKNQAGRSMLVAVSCLKEMIRFQVVEEVEEFVRWNEKLGELKAEAERREAESQQLREEERKRYERRVIVRKKAPATHAPNS